MYWVAYTPKSTSWNEQTSKNKNGAFALHRLLVVLLVVLTGIAACQPEPVSSSLVSLVVDGRVLDFQISEPMTVEMFLQEAKVELGANDRLTPPRFTQISDGLRITIVRVEERQECVRENIPFEREIVLNEGLAPNEERVAQVGQNGEQQVCYRISIEDGVERSRSRIGQPTLITSPVNEIVIVGIDIDLEPVPISGTLAYLNNGNAWVVKGNSVAKRPLTTTGTLDSLVLSLSDDGRYLLYTAKSSDPSEFVNYLWLVETSGTSEPVRLTVTDVLAAQWMPGQEDTISYTTGEAQELFPYWRALNNLWNVRIDRQTGRSLSPQQIVPESGGGLLGWWGTIFRWSPDGQRLAWARSDSMGLLDESNGLVPYFEYAFFRTSQNWSWRANLSWSWDSQLVATTIHGAPLGTEPPETSPVFHVAVASADGLVKATVVENAGIWASPKFSPPLYDAETSNAQGMLAYLRARDPFNSISGEYDLVIADRDGSNARRIFPRENQPGITTKDFGLTPQDFSWSPDGRQIAVTYQGNIWVVDVFSGVAHQLTFDGRSEHPVWSR